jgi:DNA-binding transcriptional regulator WhiA
MKIKETFSEQIKKELCGYIYKTQLMQAILSSFLNNNLTISFTEKGEI